MKKRSFKVLWIWANRLFLCFAIWDMFLSIAWKRISTVAPLDGHRPPIFYTESLYCRTKFLKLSLFCVCCCCKIFPSLSLFIALLPGFYHSTTVTMVAQNKEGDVLSWTVAFTATGTKKLIQRRAVTDLGFRFYEIIGLWTFRCSWAVTDKPSFLSVFLHLSDAFTTRCLFVSMLTGRFSSAL